MSPSVPTDAAGCRNKWSRYDRPAQRHNVMLRLAFRLASECPHRSERFSPTRAALCLSFWADSFSVFVLTVSPWHIISVSFRSLPRSGGKKQKTVHIEDILIWFSSPGFYQEDVTGALGPKRSVAVRLCNRLSHSVPAPNSTPHLLSCTMKRNVMYC